MKIPGRIRQTKEFNKLRIMKHRVTDSKNRYKDKLIVHVNERFREKRKLSRQEKKELDKKINKCNNQQEIPEFNSSSPLVSIIIVNRNGKHHLKRLLGSIKDMTSYPNYEIIIVDNASTDKSKEVIKSHSELPITLIENDKNQTFSYANNQAVEISNGEYLLFLNNDIKPLKGWLNHLMKTILSNEKVGAVGAKLIYPDCSKSDLNKEKSYMLQHTGIIFKEKDGYIKPHNRDNGIEYDDIQNNDTEEEIIAVTAATLLIQKNKYDEVGGFDNEYVYGYEDVDLCLKLYKKGYKNIYNPKATLYHYEFGTQEKNNRAEIRDRRLNNQRIFINRWNYWLKNKLFEDKIENKQIFTDKPLTIAFVVTQADEDTTAGDYFTALTLANKLEKFGWNIKYLAQHKKKNERNWYYVDEEIDVLISLLDRYDLSKVECDNGLLIKIAWLRNWFERWTDHPYFNKYDIILASSNKACERIKYKTGKNAILYPLATDPVMFNDNINPNNEFICDYCFTGSYWDAPREIIDCLAPEELSYKFNLYGTNWNKIDKLKDYCKGFISYDVIPEIYASTKIVLDDANHVTRRFGSVNSRVFDTIASNKLIITNGSIGNDELFNGEIPEYHSKDELKEILTYYLENPDEMEEKINKLKTIVFKDHTYKQRADKLKEILQEYVSKPKIAIKIPVPSWKEIYKWGDYYIAEGLQEGFNKRGFDVKIQVLPEWDDRTDSIVDTVLVIRGLSKYTPKVQHTNILWNISHPDEVTLDEYEEYDKVYIASNKWTKYINNKTEVDVECMLQCTNPNRFFPDYKSNYKHELLFVGNSRKVYRQILKDLLPTQHDLAVYGADWEGIIDSKYIISDHLSNKNVRYAYSSCDILLNDHWKDMKEKGFISNRIFDGIACGACIISDDIVGLNEVFPDIVLTYKTSDELKQLIEENINHKSKIDPDIIKGHTYLDRVDQILNYIN